MANILENTLTFSGADIEVVAYRNLINIRTENSKLNSELKELEGEASRLNKKVNELSKEQSFIQANITSQQEKEFLNSINSHPGAGFSSISNEGGSYQNMRHLIETSAGLTSQIKKAGEESTFINDKAERAGAKLKSLIDTNIFSLGSLHTLSYSSFREKMAVRTLGRSSAKDYSRGPRTIAGTMVFNLFQEHELIKLAAEIKGEGSLHPDAIMIDQIDPFNLMILFANEYGGQSVMHLFNVDIQSEGQQMSIDSIITHNTMNFYATDMIPLQNLGNTFYSYSEMISETTRKRERAKGSRSAERDNIKNRIDGLTSPYADPKNDEIQRLLSTSRGLF